MPSEEMKNVFKEVADIASNVPESMQAAAFNRALDVLLEERGLGTAANETDASSRRKRTRKKSSRAIKRGVVAKAEKRGSGRKGRKTGPKAAIRELIESSNFFETARTITDIQKHLSTKRALRFEQLDLSPPLGALVREGILDRDKNENNVYEYRLP